jgi:Protein of unknown function (DUF2490)
MMRFRLTYLALSALLIGHTAGARAADDVFEFWINPSIEVSVDDDTAVELETAQRFRDADDGGADTYFGRLWLKQDVSDAISLSAAIERRINDGAANETRFLQQMNARHGILRGRVRLEQRLVDGAAQTGWRIRARAGVSVPLDDDGRWDVHADAEPFWTLRATSATGQQGLTGLRTQVGLGYEVNERLSLSLTYLRQQDIRDQSEDTVAHAPLIGIEASF